MTFTHFLIVLPSHPHIGLEHCAEKIVRSGASFCAQLLRLRYESVNTNLKSKWPLSREQQLSLS